MHAVLTSARGDARRVVSLAELEPVGARPAVALRVHPDQPRQTVLGIGSSLTQASAAALASLPPAARGRVLELAFGPDGAALSMVRTPIASCDFSTASYTYAPTPDPALADFSLQVDRDNGHLALLRDAAAVAGAGFRLVASPWTAPPWMKDNGAFHDPAAKRGGRLLPEHHDTFARYTARYIEAMADEGLAVWAVTPVNEPHGNQGTWESMEMEPAEQAAYVATLGAVLADRGLDTRVLVYDQNRGGMRDFVRPIYSSPAAAPHAWGTAVHWYDSTFRVYEDELEALHAEWPDRPILQTEGCIDNVFSYGEPRGPEAPTPWWQDDAWYWQKVATDWGWDWAPNPEVDHPPYAAAFRYARDLVGGLAHWLAGWIDWNLVLNRHGGPNHVGNFCLAPILVDGEAVYVTPLFDVLAQVSRHTRPGAQVLHHTGALPEGLWAVALRNPDGARAVHLFNENDHPVELVIGWEERVVPVACPAAALLTVALDGPPATPSLHS